MSKMGILFRALAVIWFVVFLLIPGIGVTYYCWKYALPQGGLFGLLGLLTGLALLGFLYGEESLYVDFVLKGAEFLWREGTESRND